MLKIIKTEKFSRYEFKFLLSKKKANQIESEIKNFMILDENALRKKNKKYFVRSLYFDTPEYSNFYEKVDGIKIRKKFRIRSYSSDKEKNPNLFLEMKGRKNQKTYKLRTPILNDHLEYFLDKKKVMSLLKFYSKDNKVISDFIFESLKKNIEPKVVVDYNRRPYINKFGLLFRLTFDTNLKSSCGVDIFDDKKILILRNVYPVKLFLSLNLKEAFSLGFIE